MKIHRLLAVLLALLTACAPATPAPQPATLTPPARTQAPATLRPSPTPRPPTVTPSPTLTPIRICSPLQNFDYAEIAGMVNKPFVAPRPGNDDGHHGIDLVWSIDSRPIEGAEVQAVLDGVVAAVIRNRDPYGNAVILETPYNNLPPTLIARWGIAPGTSLYTAYAHFADAPTLSQGQAVTCGQTLGQVGNTGWSDAPHLHFETRLGPPGQRFESMAFYTTSATAAELESYRAWRMSGLFVLCNPIEFFTLGHSG
ncbi:MAG: M23 family metallopeptidase [Anaerolineales bacterium]